MGNSNSVEVNDAIGVDALIYIVWDKEDLEAQVATVTRTLTERCTKVVKKQNVSVYCFGDEQGNVAMVKTKNVSAGPPPPRLKEVIQKTKPRKIKLVFALDYTKIACAVKAYSSVNNLVHDVVGKMEKTTELPLELGFVLLNLPSCSDEDMRRVHQDATTGIISIGRNGESVLVVQKDCSSVLRVDQRCFFQSSKEISKFMVALRPPKVVVDGLIWRVRDKKCESSSNAVFGPVIKKSPAFKDSRVVSGRSGRTVFALDQQGNNMIVFTSSYTSRDYKTYWRDLQKPHLKVIFEIDASDYLSDPVAVKSKILRLASQVHNDMGTFSVGVIVHNAANAAKMPVTRPNERTSSTSSEAPQTESTRTLPPSEASQASGFSIPTWTGAMVLVVLGIVALFVDSLLVGTIVAGALIAAVNYFQRKPKEDPRAQRAAPTVEQSDKEQKGSSKSEKQRNGATTSKQRDFGPESIRAALLKDLAPIVESVILAPASPDTVLKFLATLPTCRIPKIFVVGQVGVGKSTLINTLLMDNQAKAAGGMKAGGQSVTKQITRYILPDQVVREHSGLQGFSLVDLPGVEDEETKRMLVSSVKAAIVRGDPFKVVFVVDAANGRQDQLERSRTFIEESLPRDVTFGVILNKLHIDGDPEEVLYKPNDLVTRYKELAAYTLSSQAVLLVPHDDKAAKDRSNGQLSKMVRDRTLSFLEALSPARFLRSEKEELQDIRAMAEGCGVIYFFSQVCEQANGVDEATRKLLIKPNITLDAVVRALTSVKKTQRSDEFEDNLNVLLSAQNRVKQAERKLQQKLVKEARLSFIRDVRHPGKPMYVVLVAPIYKRISLVFRGSQTLRDWFQNAQVFWRNSKADGGRVHPGFDNYLSGIYEEVKEKICEVFREGHNRNFHLYVTGHSLGGALAVLFTERFTKDKAFADHVHSKKATCVTFGAPQVGDVTFAVNATRSNIKYIRVANPKDPVPLLVGIVDTIFQNGLYVVVAVAGATATGGAATVAELAAGATATIGNGALLATRAKKGILNPQYMHFGKEFVFAAPAETETFDLLTELGKGNILQVCMQAMNVPSHSQRLYMKLVADRLQEM